MGVRGEVTVMSSQSFARVPFQRWQRLFRCSRPDVVVRVKNGQHSRNLALDGWARLSGCTYLGWENHPGDIARANPKRTVFRPSLGLWRAPLWLHAAAVHRTVAISRFVASTLVNSHCFVTEKVDVVYPGVELGPSATNLGERTRVRAEWGVPPNAVVVGAIGRLVRSKRFDFALAACARAAQLAPDLPLYFVFAGVGDAKPALESLAGELGIAPICRFPGWQASARVAWQGIDLQLLPSGDEGLGLALIEGMGSGIPALAADIGGMREVLYGDLATSLLPIDDVDVWADAIRRFVTRSEDSLAEQRQMVRARMQSRFDPARQWGEMVTWIEKQHLAVRSN
jgi:glycosyltransferase involved in cell wall biosynthesis